MTDAQTDTTAYGLSSLLPSADGPSPEDLEEEIRHLRAALESRATIGQATGIVMAQLDTDADLAFAQLRRRSMHENRKLVVIAEEIVLTRQSRMAAEVATHPKGEAARPTTGISGGAGYRSRRPTSCHGTS